MPTAIPTTASSHIHQDSSGSVEPMNHHRPTRVAEAIMTHIGCKLAAKDVMGHRDNTPKIVIAGPPIPARTPPAPAPTPARIWAGRWEMGSAGLCMSNDAHEQLQ